MLPEPDEWAREVNRYPAPEGTRFAWRADEDGFGLPWSTDPDKVKGRGCRYTVARVACGAPAVAALNRGKSADKPRWWAYCEEHLFGRVLDDGKIYSLVLEEVEP